MFTFHAFMLAAVVLTAGDASGGPATVHAAVREALREAAPMPSGLPVLPEGAFPAGQVTQADRAMKREAERMAIEHAKKGTGQPAHEVRGGAAHQGEPGEMMMSGEREGGDPSSDPAEMMRSRGTMPGKDHTMPPDFGPPHRGM